MNARLAQVIGMWLRRVPVRTVFAVHRRLRDAGVDVPVAALETHFLAGGDLENCAEAMLEAKERAVEADWQTVVVIDLAGSDPLAAVRAGADLRRVVGGGEYEGRFRKPKRPER